MEGFILAAGYGTRLRPLTNDRPKALVEVCGKTLLQHAIEKLQAAGIDHLVVNVHHFADMVVDFVRSRQWQCTIDISDESAQLLDTGGGLKHAAHLFSGRENVLVHNVDVFSCMCAFSEFAAHKWDMTEEELAACLETGMPEPLRPFLLQ